MIDVIASGEQCYDNIRALAGKNLLEVLGVAHRGTRELTAIIHSLSWMLFLDVGLHFLTDCFYCIH